VLAKKSFPWRISEIASIYEKVKSSFTTTPSTQSARRSCALPGISHVLGPEYAAHRVHDEVRAIADRAGVTCLTVLSGAAEDAERGY